MPSSIRNPDYPHLEVGGLTFVETCSACPEQYDIYSGGSMIGWAHLRNGYFQVTDQTQVNTLYSAEPDDSDGMFTSYERDYYLTEAARAVKENYEAYLDTL